MQRRDHSPEHLSGYCAQTDRSCLQAGRQTDINLYTAFPVFHKSKGVWMHKLARVYIYFLSGATALNSLIVLILRLWIAKIFLTSGILKASDWGSTLALFTYEHPVPFLP